MELDKLLLPVTVVIPVLNGEKTLSAQIGALVSQMRMKSEIIVVDNRSTDGTKDLVRRLASDSPHLIRLIFEPRPGANFARNRGIQEASHELVLLCDADDVVSSDWISSLAISLSEADVAGGAIQCSSLNGGKPFIPSGGMFNFDSPWGGCCGLKRSIWAKVGGFNVSLRGRWEEADFFIRAQMLGAQLSWAPDALLIVPGEYGSRSKLRHKFRMGLNSSATYWFGKGMGFSHKRKRLRVLLVMIVSALKVVRKDPWPLGSLVFVVGSVSGDVRFGFPSYFKGFSAKRRP